MNWTYFLLGILLTWIARHEYLYRTLVLILLTIIISIMIVGT